ILSGSPLVRARLVIVGGGLAGHRAAMQLRRMSDDAEIILMDLEKGLPYDRPPLTKQFLLGKMAETDLVLSGARKYEELSINYYPGMNVVDVDPAQKILGCECAGRTAEFHYDRLLLTTGSQPRRLLGCDAVRNVYYLRSLADAAQLKAALLPGRHIAVVGG